MVINYIPVLECLSLSLLITYLLYLHYTILMSFSFSAYNITFSIYFLLQKGLLYILISHCLLIQCLLQEVSPRSLSKNKTTKKSINNSRSLTAFVWQTLT